MTRPTFVAQGPLVRIHVKGVPDPRGFPYLPDDRGLVGALLHAMNTGEVPRDVRFDLCGGGQFIGLWTAEDAPLVIAWLEQHANRIEEH